MEFRSGTFRLLPQRIALLLAVAFRTWASCQTPAEIVQESSPRVAVQVLSERLATAPNNQTVRFALGIAKTLAAFERFRQELYEHGAGAPFDEQSGPGPWSVAHAPKAKAKRVDRTTIERWVRQLGTDLADAERTLAEVRSPEVKIVLNLTQIAFDADGDGKVDSKDFLRLGPFAGIRPMRVRPDPILDAKRPAKAGDPPAIVVAFDLADARWFQGYCHFTIALTEIALAFDAGRAIDLGAPALFPNVASPFASLGKFEQDTGPGGGEKYDMAPTLNFVAGGIALLNLPINRPEHLKKALEHLKAVPRLSRECWALILAETDDDCEWIPSPRQTHSPIGLKVTAEHVAAWGRILDELDAILDGKVLVAHPRLGKDRGFNLRRMFLEPQPTFEPVLWIHGAAVLPYLERGRVSNWKFWEDASRPFGQDFGLYALWFN